MNIQKEVKSFSTLIILYLVISLPAISQSLVKESIPDGSLRKNALNVHMETTSYIRKEIPFVNYVRDIKEAQLIIITTIEKIGSGGSQITYFFDGQLDMEGMKDTVKCIISPDYTLDKQREIQVKALKMALMRYVQKTPLYTNFDIVFTKPLTDIVHTDKWDNWVFKTSVNGSASGHDSFNSTNIRGNFSSSRVTSEWKINTSADYNYELSKFIIKDEEIISNRRSGGMHALIVKSINDHLSIGGNTFFASSTYSNLKNGVAFIPAIEYNIYPYSESTRQQLSLMYGAGYYYANYRDTTIYNKIREHLFGHEFSIAYKRIQKWGYVYINTTWRNFFHDWSKNNLSLSAKLDLRIAKGLSLNFGSRVSMIHDQFSLVKGGATQEEILLRLKQVATQYSYEMNIGISYTFGSIYNNVVNPRFGD